MPDATGLELLAQELREQHPDGILDTTFFRGKAALEVEPAIIDPTLLFLRDKGFRFASGQFTMIGLRVEGRPLLRAYSIASAHYDEELEFFSIKVPDGQLTSRLKDLAPGDPVLVGAKATGTLLLITVPSPSCPEPLLPQQYALPARIVHA